MTPKEIRSRRLALGMSVEELARELGRCPGRTARDGERRTTSHEHTTTRADVCAPRTRERLNDDSTALQSVGTCRWLPVVDGCEARDDALGRSARVVGDGCTIERERHEGALRKSDGMPSQNRVDRWRASSGLCSSAHHGSARQRDVRERGAEARSGKGRSAHASTAIKPHGGGGKRASGCGFLHVEVRNWFAFPWARCVVGSSR